MSIFFKKESIGIIVGIIVLVGFTIWGFVDAKQQAEMEAMDNPANAEIFYYYGRECPHCKDVEKFFQEENVRERVTFAKKEVWHNEANRDEMLEHVAECKLNPADVGVPFLFSPDGCLVGSDPIITFFRQQMSE